MLRCVGRWTGGNPTIRGRLRCESRSSSISRSTSARARIAPLPIFELDRFDPTERHHLAAQDRLIVPSGWAKQISKTTVFPATGSASRP